MKNQALFSSKGKNEKLNCCRLQCLFGALRVKKPGFLLTYIWYFVTESDSLGWKVVVHFERRKCEKCIKIVVIISKIVIWAGKLSVL